MAGIDQIRGVMLNAYPDSIGGKLEDIISLLELPIFKDAFSFFYILPTFFHSDLDRGFCIIDYDINEDLASKADLDKLKSLGIKPKFDIVLNHLSVASPQFKDLLEHGGQSKYKDFFIDWNAFWQGQGTINDEGLLIPDEHHLQKLFMRKSGLPVLKVMFPDGKARYYWNTFYQKISYEKLSLTDLSSLSTISNDDCNAILSLVNDAIDAQKDLATIDFGKYAGLKEGITKILSKKRTYLGQMDVNAKSELVWQYYEDVLEKLSQFGCSILRLDAFAYLHKEVGMTNFFNKPGTWDHLARINKIAQKNGLSLLPEIHAEYGQHLHDEVSNEGYIIYDFFLPGLMIHTLEKADSTNLIKWGSEIISKGFKTVNMLGCHDGIPVLDLKGKTVDGVYHEGLLSDEQIDDIMNLVLSRGGKVKNLYGADGKKISYYQINATFFSALGEDEQKLLLARAIQLFMPGIPQIWYLDLFVGRNDHDAVLKAGPDGHKEINRTNLSMKRALALVEQKIVRDQLELIRIRNTHAAFLGQAEFIQSKQHEVSIFWKHQNDFTHLRADLNTKSFEIEFSENLNSKILRF